MNASFSDTRVWDSLPRIALFHSRRPAVERLVAASALSPEVRDLYLAHFANRLRALAQ